MYKIHSALLILALATLACALPTAAQPTEAPPPPQATTQAPGESQPTAQVGLTDVPIPASNLVQPAHLSYRGAFRLPQGGERPLTFAYGAAAMTFNPAGDPGGAGDGYTGSLYIMGHDRLPYGELPDGNQIAEVSIPAPVEGGLATLPTAEFIQDFSDVLAGRFAGLEELPRAGLLYLDNPLTGPRLHIAFGQHFQEDEANRGASHAWVSPNLADPNFQGAWYIGGQSPYSVNGYLFEIPADFAAAYTGGRIIATGRFRDGGWSGMGPQLFAYQPWDEVGNPPAPDTRLSEVTLLQYASTMVSDDRSLAMNGYADPDEWEGGAWLTTPDGRAAVVFAGTKAVGERTWYGWLHPQDATLPCIETELLGTFTLCRMADGSPCPAADLGGCEGHNDFRGWWSDRFEAQLIFYDPADLARVASGQLQPWQPQPYAVLSLEDHLLHNPDGVEPEMLGTGDQRRYRIGEMAYDRANGLLYILEWFADGAQPVVHVWAVE
ncbi:MAG: hypothetical protein HPY76_01160 [Anaerolineae bacterium]|nr:hypothetical protein [Anaerolineae bacterium]